MEKQWKHEKNYKKQNYTDKKHVQKKTIQKQDTPQEKNNGMGCPLAKKCGGCQLQHLDYAAQLKLKYKHVKELMGKFGSVSPVVGMDNPFHYRHKVHGVFGRNKKGEVISGVYEAGSHRIVKVDKCMIEDEKADAIIVSIRDLLRSFKIKTYDEDSRYGLLRHVMVRKGYATGEIMVVLVLTSPILPSKNNFVKALLKLHPEITTIVINVNEQDTTMVLGKRDIVLYGKGYIEDKLCGFTFRISPQSFYQVNPAQTEVLYRKAIEAAGLTGKERVLDAYCGTGTIGIAASPYAKEVIGVELNPEGVKDAIVNAKANEVKNIQFFREDAGVFMTKLAQEGEKVDVVFMDPPRSGSDEAFLGSVLELAPKKVVYVSCNPETLARDTEVLVKGGYKVRGIWPIDLFPGTVHVETVCLLSKLNTKQHIEINLDMDELDLTDAEKKATYQEIKDYVLEHSGLKVSSLYIAQVKQKCGIIKRENYNKPKSEDAKQPQCPPDKEKAIKEALKHFGMI